MGLVLHGGVEEGEGEVFALVVSLFGEGVEGEGGDGPGPGGEGDLGAGGGLRGWEGGGGNGEEEEEDGICEGEGVHAAVSVVKDRSWYDDRIETKEDPLR